jgi:hypothetical protein
MVKVDANERKSSALVLIPRLIAVKGGGVYSVEPEERNHSQRRRPAAARAAKQREPEERNHSQQGVRQRQEQLSSESRSKRGQSRRLDSPDREAGETPKREAT